MLRDCARERAEALRLPGPSHVCLCFRERAMRMELQLMQAKGIRKPSSSAKTIMAMAAETGRRRMGRSLKQLNWAGPGLWELDPAG